MDVSVKFLVLLLLSFQCFANPPALTLGNEITLKSELLNEDRPVWVALPKGYRADHQQGYPLLLVLDARAMFHPAVAMVQSLASAGTIPQMVVVGIRNTHRWRDLTPSADANWPDSGGGERFFRFIDEELLPELARRYNTASYRVFAGHSLGGLMAVHGAMSVNPQFDSYIALSPTVSWSDTLFERWLLQLKLHRHSPQRQLYMALADERDDVVPMARLAGEIQANHKSGIVVQTADFSLTDDHHSVRVPALLDGLRWAFRDWQLRPQQIYAISNSDIDLFYQQAANKYRLPRQFDLMQMTNAAYWGLPDSKLQPRAMELFKEAVKRWPEDAYAWSCLGEGYERIGDLDNAYNSMHKAVKLGEQQGFADMAYLRALLLRVERKLAEQENNPLM